MELNSKIYIAGHRGLVGSAIWKNLTEKGYTNLIGRTSEELDLLDPIATAKFFEVEKPEYVFLAAAYVGGIMANNTYRADFIYKNLQIQQNVIYNSYKQDITKLLFLGSTCIYPKEALQPINENELLTNTLEYTNEPYAIAKIAGIKMCESFNIQYGTNFISVMPTNLYGPNDNFDLQTSHVLPAMIRKFHEAKKNKHAPVKLWGTGKPMREFLFVDDLADAVLFALENKLNHHLYNVGTGIDITIKELALKIQKITGHEGEIIWDNSKPDGTPRKLMDVSRLKNAGWKYKTSLDEGLQITYNWFLANQDNFKEVKI